MIHGLKPFTTSALVLGLALSLSACTAGQINTILNPPAAIAPSARPTPTSLFSDALSRRVLPIANSTPQGGAQTPGQPSGASGAQPPATAPAAAPALAPAVGREMAKIAPGAPVADRMMMPWYGGGEFNQYVIQFAEESLFKPTRATTLLKAYADTVKPLLSQWDASARLIESRANLGMENNPDFIEYISLPGREGETELIRPLYIFRFASTPRKETLNIYLLAQETRVQRMVWGEPQIDLGRVKLDSGKARELSLKALTSQSKADYPVYPAEFIDPDQEVITEIPENAQWQIQLNQQGQQQSRYFVSVTFEVKPTRRSTLSEGLQKDGSRCFTPESPAQTRVWGSVELDTATGEIKQVNRPVLYNPAMRCYPPISNKPQPMPAGTVQPVPEAEINCITTPCPWK